MTIRGIVHAQGAGIGSYPQGPSFITSTSVDPMIMIRYSNCLLENIGVGGPGDGILIKDTSCATLRNVAAATAHGGAAGLVIDGSFWIVLDHIVLQAGTSSGYNMKLIQTTAGSPPPAGLGLIQARDIKPQGGKGILISPTYWPCGSFVFEDILQEGIATGASLIEIDSTNDYVTDVKIIRPQLADFVKPGYILKNTGSKTRTIYIEEPGSNSETLIEPNSTPIWGLRVDMSSGLGALYWKGIYPSYAQSWRADYPEAMTQKLFLSSRAHSWCSAHHSPRGKTPRPGYPITKHQ